MSKIYDLLASSIEGTHERDAEFATHNLIAMMLEVARLTTKPPGMLDAEWLTELRAAVSHLEGTIAHELAEGRALPGILDKALTAAEAYPETGVAYRHGDAADREESFSTLPAPCVYPAEPQLGKEGQESVRVNHPGVRFSPD